MQMPLGIVWVIQSLLDIHRSVYIEIIR